MLLGLNPLKLPLQPPDPAHRSHAVVHDAAGVADGLSHSWMTASPLLVHVFISVTCCAKLGSVSSSVKLRPVSCRSKLPTSTHQREIVTMWRNEFYLTWRCWTQWTAWPAPHSYSNVTLFWLAFTYKQQVGVQMPVCHTHSVTSSIWNCT